VPLARTFFARLTGLATASAWIAWKKQLQDQAARAFDSGAGTDGLLVIASLQSVCFLYCASIYGRIGMILTRWRGGR
jgi:hypothetical protein